MLDGALGPDELLGLALALLLVGVLERDAAPGLGATEAQDAVLVSGVALAEVPGAAEPAVPAERRVARASVAVAEEPEAHAALAALEGLALPGVVDPAAGAAVALLVAAAEPPVVAAGPAGTAGIVEAAAGAFAGLAVVAELEHHAAAVVAAVEPEHHAAGSPDSSAAAVIVAADSALHPAVQTHHAAHQSEAQPDSAESALEPSDPLEPVPVPRPLPVAHGFPCKTAPCSAALAALAAAALASAESAVRVTPLPPLAGDARRHPEVRCSSYGCYCFLKHSAGRRCARSSNSPGSRGCCSETGSDPNTRPHSRSQSIQTHS